LDARLEPELLVQERPRPPVDVEPFRLPAAPVEREHQLCTEALAIWMLSAERLELRDERELAPERGLRVDPLLDRGQQQQREQRALLRSSDRDRGVVHPNRERTEDSELEAARCHRAQPDSPPPVRSIPGSRRVWDSFGTSLPDDADDALHSKVLLARRHRGRAPARRLTGQERNRGAATNGLPR